MTAFDEAATRFDALAKRFGARIDATLAVKIEAAVRQAESDVRRLARQRDAPVAAVLAEYLRTHKLPAPVVADLRARLRS